LGHFKDTTTTPPIDTWGLVADTIVGKLVASNELIITNSNSSFMVSGSQVGITNMDLQLSANNGSNTININPTSGISILKGATPVFSLDSSGNIKMSGSLVGATGTFAGMLQSATGKFVGDISESTGLTMPTWNTLTNKPNYVSGSYAGAPSGLYMDGTNLGFWNGSSWKTYMDKYGNFYLSGAGSNSLSWNGSTLIINGSGTFSGDISAASGSFSGTIYANKIYGAVDWSQITNAPVPSDRINNGSGYSLTPFSTGYLAPTRIDSGYWNFGGGWIGTHPSFGSRLDFTGGGTVTGAGGMGFQSTTSSVQIYAETSIILTANGGSIYKGSYSSSNEILSRSELPSPGYGYNDSPYFSATYATSFNIWGGGTGKSINVSVMKSSGVGGYGLTFTAGILTGTSQW